MTRWERSFDLLLVLAGWAARDPSGVAEPRGYTEEAIAAREMRLPFPIPEPVRMLFRWFTPERWHAMTGGRGEPRLLDLNEACWSDYHDGEITEPNDAPTPPNRRAEDWEAGLYFRFAAFGYGDLLMYCANPPVPPAGKLIVMGGGDMEEHLVLGESLGQWLSRLYDCRGYEYGYTLSSLQPDEDTGLGLDEPLRGEFLRDKEKNHRGHRGHRVDGVWPQISQIPTDFY